MIHQRPESWAETVHVCLYSMCLYAVWLSFIQVKVDIILSITGATGPQDLLHGPSSPQPSLSQCEDMVKNKKIWKTRWLKKIGHDCIFCVVRFRRRGFSCQWQFVCLMCGGEDACDPGARSPSMCVCAADEQEERTSARECIPRKMCYGAYQWFLAYSQQLKAFSFYIVYNSLSVWNLCRHGRRPAILAVSARNVCVCYEITARLFQAWK